MQQRYIRSRVKVSVTPRPSFQHSKTRMHFRLELIFTCVQFSGIPPQQRQHPGLAFQLWNIKITRKTQGLIKQQGGFFGQFTRKGNTLQTNLVTDQLKSVYYLCLFITNKDLNV